MTKVYIADTTQSITVDEAVYTVQVASAASDTTVSTSGSGNSLIASSTGGAHVLKSLASGTNITLTDDGNTITVSSIDTEDDLSNNDTDDLSEGSTNQYFTDARVMTALETVSGHVIPSANVTYDLGSTTHMWRDAYIGPGSLYINGQKVISSDTGEINITTDANENLNIQAGGDITVLSAGLTTNIQDTTVNLGPANNTGTTNVRGTLDVAVKIEMGDTDITSGQIHHDATNGDLTLKTNGTGKVIADTSNLVVGTLAGDNTQITPTGITGDVTGTVSSIANHDTGDLTEGSNLYYTDARADARVNLQTGANLDLSNKSTTNLSEGSNLYYTDARADARAQIKIDALVDSAPGTLDTLNELAAALGDDANFSTTVTNSIATKWTQDNTKISNWDTAYGWGDHSTEGYLTSFTETNDLSSAVTWANVPDANITQSSVTQHQAALSITESQISDLTHFSGSYTDLTNKPTIPTNNNELTNGAGYITTYDPTQADITQHQAALSITESQISDLTHYTDSDAISAVEGEATLDLTGALTVDGQISTDNVIKVDDGFLLTSFNPYGAGNTMSTAIMGVGKQDGWAGVAIRNRGEHDFGLGSQYNLAPRELLALQAGRHDGSNNDDYLNSGDEFGVVSGMAYSGYRTGTEWLTPSGEIGFVATEDHSSSGMGTKIAFHSTANGGTAGQFDTSHFTDTIYFQDTTITTTDTLKIDDDLEITGTLKVDGSISATDNVVDFADNVKITGSASTKNSVIGDYLATSNNYASHGLQIDAGDTAWPIINFKEYEGGANKPVNAFTNPGFSTEVIGGTPSSPAALSSGKRIFAMTGTASIDSSGGVPGTANMRVVGVTTEAQTGSNRGAKLELHSTSDGSSGSEISLTAQGNRITIGEGGNGIIQASNGSLVLDDAVEVTGTFDVDGNATFDGNVTLGNANSDVITSTGKFKASNGFNNSVLDVATANYLSGLGIVEVGDQIYCEDGANGDPCLAFYDGTNWKQAHKPTHDIST